MFKQKGMGYNNVREGRGGEGESIFRIYNRQMKRERGVKRRLVLWSDGDNIHRWHRGLPAWSHGGVVTPHA